MLTKSIPLRISIVLAVVGTLVAFQNCSPSSLGKTTQEANSQPTDDITAQKAARESASARTQELLSLHKRWLNAPTSERAQLHQQLLAKAEQRRQLLKDLIQSHPAEVLRAAIPKEQQQGMPADVLEFLEQKLKLEGEFEAVYEDYEDGTHKLRHFLKDSKGKRYEVHSSKKDIDVQSGYQVSLTGYLLDNQVVTAECCDSTASDPINLTSNKTFGEFKTLVILVNFEDKPEEPYTIQQVNDMVFNKVSGFFMEASNNRTWLTGNVTGWYTIAQSSTVCNQWNIATLANEAAIQAGVDTSNYNRYMYILCGFLFHKKCREQTRCLRKNHFCQCSLLI